MAMKASRNINTPPITGNTMGMTWTMLSIGSSGVCSVPWLGRASGVDIGIPRAAVRTWILASAGRSLLLGLKAALMEGVEHILDMLAAPGLDHQFDLDV